MVTTPGVHLRRTAEQADEIDGLAARCGGRVGLEGVLADLDRRGHATWVPGLAADYGFAWDREDGATRQWWPQGITSSADAGPGLHGAGRAPVGGRQLLVTSWYAKEVAGVSPGVRITVVDLATLRYRHVLVVRPSSAAAGPAGLEPLRVHAGGLVWHGPYLHIAATARGLVTCRLDDLLLVPEAAGLETFGHRYVLPARFSYRAGSDDGVQRLRYSFLSLEHRPDGAGLVVGEYGRPPQTTRLARYELDPATGQLRTGVDGAARPLVLDERGAERMQGAVVVDGTWYVTASRSAYRPGTLYAGRPGAFERHRFALPIGPEDITYWPAHDALWSLTEHPRRRWVFAMDRRRFLR